MNWFVWRRCWILSLDRYLWTLRTPWFQIVISGGSPEWVFHEMYWYGIRAHWKHAKGWNVDPSGILFFAGDQFLSISSYGPNA